MADKGRQERTNKRENDFIAINKESSSSSSSPFPSMSSGGRAQICCWRVSPETSPLYSSFFPPFRPTHLPSDPEFAFHLPPSIFSSSSLAIARGYRSFLKKAASRRNKKVLQTEKEERKGRAAEKSQKAKRSRKRIAAPPLGCGRPRPHPSVRDDSECLKPAATITTTTSTLKAEGGPISRKREEGDIRQGGCSDGTRRDDHDDDYGGGKMIARVASSRTRARDQRMTTRRPYSPTSMLPRILARISCKALHSGGHG